MSNRHKVCIIGAGAVGLFLTARFSRHYDTTLAVRDTASAGKESLAVRGAEQFEISRKHFALVDIQDIPPADSYWLATKAFDLIPALQQVTSKISRHATIVVLSNGLGLFDEAVGCMGEDAIVVRVAPQFGVQKTGALEVTVAGNDPYVQLACAEQHAARGESIKQILSGAGINADDLPSVAVCEWRKAAINIVVNGIASVLDKKNGCILATPELRKLAGDMLAEITRVAQCEGVDIGLSSSALLQGLERHKHNINSTLADIRAGKRTEIEYLFDRFLAHAASHGIAVPCVESITSLLRYRAKPPVNLS